MKYRLLIFLFLSLSLKGLGQSCTLSVAISQSAPAICSGYSITLTATPSAGTAPYTYVWSTGETTQSISVNKGDTYTVTVSDKTPGCQPVKQSVTVIVSPTPNAPTATGQVVCPNSSATLMATAPGGEYQWYDKSTGGNFLASGDTFTTPPLTANTTYYVQTTVGGCTSIRTAVAATIVGKPAVTGASICAGNVATLSASGGNSYTWYDAPSGGNVVSTNASFTTPVLDATKTYYVVVIVNGCVSAPTPVTATVTPQPQAPTASGVTICSGSVASLHATGNGGIYDWFTTPTGGKSLISSPDYTTPPLTATTTYYVQNTSGNCESTRTPVTVTVNQVPATPASQSDSTCYGTSTVLTAGTDPSLTYQWYDAATGGNLLATGITFTTPVLNNTTTYYLSASNGGCGSGRAPVNVIVKPLPGSPSVVGDIICPGSATTLTATAPGGTYQWYDAATGGNLLATGASFTTPAINANTTYYVETILNGCISSRTAVTVTVSATITPPTAASTSTCMGSAVSLTASGSSGGYNWFDSATGGNLLSTAQVYVTPALTTTTTYYVAATSNGCTSARTAVTVTVNPIPNAPTANGTTICTGTSASLTASAASGTIQWYDAATAGNLLSTSNTYNTPALNATTTFYAQNTVGQCVSSRTAVTVTVTPSIDPQFQYSSGTYCVTAPNPTPVLNNPAGGNFSSTPTGLFFVSSTTGEINIAASAPGNYLISFIGNDACPHTTTAPVKITTNANSVFSYNGPYCQDGTNPLPNYSINASGGTFSASPAGLVFVNTSTGEINLSASTPGTYNVTNNIPAGGTCPASSSNASVTINKPVVVNAGPDQAAETGTTVQLAGSVTGASTTGTWSGGTGNFSNPSQLNSTYTPGAGETVATLTLTSTAVPGNCGTKTDKVVITYSTTPASPTVANASACAGSNVTLSATAPGGSYTWYDAASGGNLLQTGPVYVTPQLNATATYYVQTTVNGVTSARSSVVVTVTGTPQPPAAQNGQACYGNTTTLTATGSAGSYQWYDAPTGGDLLSTNSSYVTPALTSNTSFYVQSVVNGCVSTRTRVDVTVTNVPNITSAQTGTICGGTALNYTITADLASATFSWSRAQVAGISNPAVTGQTSALINETLLNTTGAAVNVTYVITAQNGACAGPAFNYVVTVNPSPMVIGAASITACYSAAINYNITFNTPANFTWSRDTTAGISNAPVSGQTASTIKEVLFNTTNQPVNVNYVINYNTGTCNAAPFNLVVTVNPAVKVTSAATGTACSGYAQAYQITSNIATATFVWSRAAVNNISNPAVSNQTSAVIDETLVNQSSSAVNVTYIITPTANGCAGVPVKHVVTVNPKIPTPVANANSPVCIGSIVHLRTPTIAGATYLWTGPNGFSSALQNPDITNVSDVNTGSYSLIITVKGCSSQPDSVAVIIDQPSVANAGPNQKVCAATTAVALAGTVTGGSSTGIWTTAGTGTFSPEPNVLNAIYLPSDADKAAGSVMLTLTSTSKDDCTISTSSMTITFGPSPAVDAGPDQSVCAQEATVQIAGKLFFPGGVTWVSSGSGTFSPSPTLLNAIYIPSVADSKNGTVTLTLQYNNPTICTVATDSMKVTFTPLPTVNAGGTRYVLKNKTITLMPTVSDNNVKYKWSPNLDINNDTLKNPVITGEVDRTYTLTITNAMGCTASDSTIIKVSPEIQVTNTFTPNGDGINDLWDLVGLSAYQNATVDIYTRYGQSVYHSIGYPKAWDGTYNGQPLPVGVYYYVINTHFADIVLSGYVTIIR